MFGSSCRRIQISRTRATVPAEAGTHVEPPFRPKPEPTFKPPFRLKPAHVQATVPAEAGTHVEPPFRLKPEPTLSHRSG
jgi:hypothetical protein